MQNRDAAPGTDPGYLAAWARDIKVAVIFYTRLPIPTQSEIDGPALARAQRAAPVAGVVVGLAGAIVYGIAMQLSLPEVAGALLALAATALVTGALHEDGLADTADGLGGGRTREDKLRIMRDSRLGSYGALALLFSVGLRAAALSTIAHQGAVAVALLTAGVVSRAVLPAIMTRLPPARGDGLAADTGTIPSNTAASAVILATVMALLIAGPAAGIVALLAGGAAAAAVLVLAKRQLGGYTGDLLGAAQQVAETSVLLALAALA